MSHSRTGFLLALAVLSGRGPLDAQTETKPHALVPDRDRLQGDWVMVEYGSIRYKDGLPDQFHFNLYIHKDRAIFHFEGTDPDDEIVSMFTLDASRTPRTIDFVGVSSTITGFRKGTTYRGIYRLDGDTLTLTLAEQDRPVRPPDFKHDRDRGFSTYKFVRSRKPIAGDSTRAWERPR